MRRMQLIEIADQNWCPSVLRDALTQFLQLSTQRGKYYGAILQRLKQALIQARSQRVVDLCSGSGGPWISMQEEIQDTEVTEIVLTDLRPNIQAVASQTAERIIYRSEPVDARDVPPGLTGFRTLFTSFHHFSPHNAAAILKNAVQANQGIGIFEMTERRLSVILRVLITTPLIAIFLIPFCRPFRLGYLFWTYIVPIIPLLIAFDGTISCFRTYTVEELGDMINQLRAPGYEWNIGREKSEDHHGPFTITYCIGIPIISREPDRTVDGSAQVIDTQQKG